MFATRIAIIIGLLMTATIWAQVTADSVSAVPASQNTQPLNMGWLFIKTMGILVLIVGLIIGSVYLLKKYMLGSNSMMKQSNWIQVLAQTQLQPKKNLALVKIMDRVILIGMTESSIRTLTQFEDEARIKSFMEQFKSDPKTWNESRFLGLVKKKLES